MFNGLQSTVSLHPVLWRIDQYHTGNLHAISGVASYGALGHVPLPSTFIDFIFSLLRSKSESQLYCSLRD